MAFHHAGSPLERLGRGVYAARDLVAWGWLLAILCCLPLSATAIADLTAGGMSPPGEASSVEREIVDRFGLPVATASVIVTEAPRQADAAIDSALRDLMSIPHVQGIAAAKAPRSGKGSLIVVGFSASPDTAQDSLPEVEEALTAAGLSVEHVAGLPALYVDIAEHTEKDLVRAEAVGIPAAMVVLVAVFGSLVAASAPLAVGMASVVVTLAIVHLAALVVPVSVYVVNIAAMLGLGIGIDYSLLSVARFREKLSVGLSVEDAVVDTVMHAGRATAISGLAVAAGMGALWLVPIGMMRSIAVAGVIVVAVSVAAALTLLPALLGLLGERIGARGAGKGSARWESLVRRVTRRPLPAALAGLLVLGALAVPVLGMHLDVPHGEVLPEDASSRVATAELQERFGASGAAPILVIADIGSAQAQERYLAQLRRLDGVDTAEKLASDDAGAVFAVTSLFAPEGGSAARELVAGIRTVAVPGQGTVQVGGQAAGEIEFLEVMREAAVPVALVVVAATFLILLVAFRSIVIPLKAIVLDSLSIAASLGVVVAVFELGLGASLVGAEALGYTVATLPAILFCVLFGLSMDYEVFMLSRVSEAHDRGASTEQATLEGVARTAPLVTGAALILIVVGLGFATAQIVIVKQIGVALAVALALDATIVRALLVPAVLKLAGRANWWLPAALAWRLRGGGWAAEPVAAAAAHPAGAFPEAAAPGTISEVGPAAGRYAS